MRLPNRPPPKPHTAPRFTPPKNLKDSGVVKFRKDGAKRMYGIVDQKIYTVLDALNAELISVLSKEAFNNVAYG